MGTAASVCSAMKESYSEHASCAVTRVNKLSVFRAVSSNLVLGVSIVQNSILSYSYLLFRTDYYRFSTINPWRLESSY